MEVAVTTGGDGHVEMPYGELPPPDIVDYLVDQHMSIRDLAADVLVSSGDQRRQAFDELLRLLSVHETAEEEVVHPVARRQLGDDLVGDRLEEEREAKELLQRLEHTEVDAAEFEPLFQQLRTAVISHALFEQRYELSRLRQHLSTAQRARMRTLARVAESAAPTHPHPGVESAAANLTAGPVAAVVDRARDAIRAARDQRRP